MSDDGEDEQGFRFVGGGVGARARGAGRENRIGSMDASVMVKRCSSWACGGREHGLNGGARVWARAG
jgi:hypothetical protein